MAAIFLHATSGEITMPGTVGLHTVLQLSAAAAHRVRVSGWGISFKGTNVADAPVLVTVQRQSTAGVGLNNIKSTNLNYKNTLDTETIQSGLLSGFVVVGNEPTPGALLENFEVQPQLGYRIWYPPREEIIIPNGGRVAWAITTTLTYAVDVEVDLEE